MTILEWAEVLAGSALCGAGVVEFVRAWRRTRRTRRAARERRPATELREQQQDSVLNSTAVHAVPGQPPALLTDLRTSEIQSHELDEIRADGAHLAQHLVDIRDECGAEEAILWRWDEGRDALSPIAWSTTGAERPVSFDRVVWGPLARWVAQQKAMNFDVEAGGGTPKFAAAPLLDDTQLVGVLTVTNAASLAISHDRAKVWMPRYASQVLRLLLLSEARREYARQTRQNRALLAALRKIQTNKTLESLAEAICDTAMQVSSASAAALVRWRHDRGKGSVQYQAGKFPREETFALDSESLVAKVCQLAGMHAIDGTRAGPNVGLFRDGDGGWPYGKVGIVPFLSGSDVIGAIVVAADTADGLPDDELRNLEVLGQVSSTPLEIVWEIGEVSRRARTDGLTGLMNRRAFDEQLEHLLNAADRFEQPLALVLGDIDQFKRVNDTYGHEAGDEVLRRVARKFTEGVRNVDLVARYGGEELAILMPQSSVRGAIELADRLRASVEATPVKRRGEEIDVTVSFGVASYPDTVSTREGLFRAADKALYEAKRAGRNCVRSVAIPDEAAEG